MNLLDLNKPMRGVIKTFCPSGCAEEVVSAVPHESKRTVRVVCPCGCEYRVRLDQFGFDVKKGRYPVKV